MSITRILIITNFAVFLLQEIFGDAMVASFALWPIGQFIVPGSETVVGFHVWQLITSAFLHANLLHIGLNMWALYMFGGDIERTLGAKYYLVLYFSAVITAACAQLVVVSMTASAGIQPTVGASGGVFGVLLAFGLLFPNRMIVLLFPPVPMPAWIFVLLYGLIELANGVFGTQAGVAHFAHLSGMLGGYLGLRLWRRNRNRAFEVK